MFYSCIEVEDRVQDNTGIWSIRLEQLTRARASKYCPWGSH